MSHNPQTAEELSASLEGRISRLQKYLPPVEAKPQIEPPFLTKCPMCCAPMQTCRVDVKNKVGGRMSRELSGDICWGLLRGIAEFIDTFIIRPKSQGPPEVVVGWKALQHACHCESCGFVGIKAGES